MLRLKECLFSGIGIGVPEFEKDGSTVQCALPFQVLQTAVANRHISSCLKSVFHTGFSAIIHIWEDSRVILL